MLTLISGGLAILVGTVPRAFLIGGGGLGELIFTGIDLNEPRMMLADAITTAGLAVIVDVVLERPPTGSFRAGSTRFASSLKETDPMHALPLLARRAVAPLVFAVLSASGLAAAPASAETLVVGGKNFTEQQIMAAMTSQLLEANEKVEERMSPEETYAKVKELDAEIEDVAGSFLKEQGLV